MQASNNHQPRWTIAMAAAVALITIGIGVSAQEQQAPQASAPVDQTLARKYLTDARNALSEITELPAAQQLTGEPRTRVQRLITNFNELITKTTDWRASYDKVEASLAALLATEAPAGGTPGAVGTSGTTATLAPEIREKLVEFGTNLEQFKATVSGDAASAEKEPEAPPAAPPTEPPPTEPQPTEPPPTEAPPTEPTPAEPPVTASPTAPVSEESPDNPPVDPAAAQAAESADVARDILLHVEAVEVILGAQANAQKAATDAAGGAVVTSTTPSGSTKTTITNPNVTLTPSQLDEIKTHLSEIRRLVDNKR